MACLLRPLKFHMTIYRRGRVPQESSPIILLQLTSKSMLQFVARKFCHDDTGSWNFHRRHRMSGRNRAIRRELDRACARTADEGRAFNHRSCIFRNADVNLVELPISFGVLVALNLWRIPQKLRESARDVGNRVESVVRNNAGVPQGAGDVVLVVQVEGGLEVAALREAGASAVLGPFVLPEVLVVFRLAGQCAPLLVQVVYHFRQLQ